MYENKKISKIADEVITYLLDKGGKDVEIKIEKIQDDILIKATAENIDLSKDQLDDLIHFLNTTHREQEIEEYYWLLAGEGNSSQELSLVAIMVDVAEIYYDGSQLKMDFLRKSSKI